MQKVSAIIHSQIKKALSVTTKYILLRGLLNNDILLAA
jgi:hypothetical protein